MPEPTLNYKENLNTRLPSAANVLAVLGVASLASAVTQRAYTYDPGAAPSDIRSEIGDGAGVEALASLLAQGKQRTIFVPLPASTAGSIGSVTKTRPTGSGTPVSITPSAVQADSGVSIAGPWDSLHVCLKMTSATTFRYCLDDRTKNGLHVGTFSGDIAIPVAAAASIVGTADLSLISVWGNGGDLDTLTFIIDSDTTTPVTVTFADPADPADVVSQINATNGGGTKFLAALVGSYKLVIYSITTGTSGTLAIGAGTANSVLGFTTSATATGTAATYTIPYTGVTLTFAAGTYVLGDLYTFDTNAPRCSAAALATAMLTLRAAAADGALVGGVWPAQEDADAIDARTMVDAFYTALQAAQTAGFDWWGLYQAPRTSKASDSDVILYISSKTAPWLAISARGFYGSGGLLPGSYFHRPASWAAAWRSARMRWSSDLGNHADGPLTSDVGVTELDGDERTASTKLATYRTAQEGDGGGFTVLETPSNQSGVAYFYRGRTMAGNGSIFGDLNTVRLALAVGRQVRADLALEQNNDPLTKSDGLLTDSEKDRITRRVRGNLESLLFEDPTWPEPHASAIGDIDPVYDPDTHALTATLSVQRKGQVKKIVINVGVVDALTLSEA